MQTPMTSVRECLTAAHDFVLAASVVANSAARHATDVGEDALAAQHHTLARSCQSRATELGQRLKEGSGSKDDLRAALDAICLGGEVVRACQDSMREVFPEDGILAEE